MNNIGTVLWDCDGNIWRHNPEEARIIAKALNITHIEEFEIQFFNMIEYFNVYFAKKRVTLEETYKMVEKEMPILYLCGISAKQFMNLWDELKFEICEFNKDTVIVMKYLQSKGIRQVVRSDWWLKTQTALLKEYGILKYIERMYCCDNEYLKCNPLSAKSNKIIKPGKEEEYVIIGDSLKSDIAFAQHAKIKSIWFNPEKKPNNTVYVPTCEITSMLEVMEII